LNRSPASSLGAAALFALLLAGCGVGGGTAVSGAAPAPGTGPVARVCAQQSFSDLRLAYGATVSSVEPVAANSYQPAGRNAPIPDLPAFCLVKGQSRPTNESLINFELWVPQDAWNGKLVTTGNGGYSPALSYNDMAYAMRQGYAVMGGDTGHQSTDPNELYWGVGHPEKIRDWGTRSIHAITVPGKALLAHLQRRAASHAYYYGCSTGGHQGYAEVQNYPQDFDGVIAGAPGNNRTALNAEFLWRYQSNRIPHTDILILTPVKSRLIADAAVAACDALDGVTDDVIGDPRACTRAHFDVESLQCSGADAADCLTPDQVAAARRIYQGPIDPRTGAQIYPGPGVGTEAGWPTYWGGAAPVRSDFWALWVFDNSQWNWWTFDYDRDLAYALARVGPLVDQVNPDISAFKARGGKLITYIGWNDPVVSPMDAIAYYEQVRTRQGTQQATDDFFRLFLAPGMGHCGGGPGPNVFGNGGNAAPNQTPDNDLLMALDRWVTQGTAPERIVASRVEGGAVIRTRPLCPYPKKSVYNGSGNLEEAGSFICQ
jgi:feruloyl esterase